MTPAEIIAIAKEAEISFETMVLLCGVEIQVTASPLSVDEMARFAALVAAREREACAQVCEALARIRSFSSSDPTDAAADVAYEHCSEAIRARSPQ